MSKTSIPVVLIGLSTAIGKPVSEAMLPEVEGKIQFEFRPCRSTKTLANLPVIHFIQSVEAALAELPHLLAGRDPQSSNDNDVGSRDYSRPARAVILGRGYSPADVELMRGACEGVNKGPVAWVVGDPAKAPAPGAPPPPPGYAKIAAGQTKDVVLGWIESGASEDEVILY